MQINEIINQLDSNYKVFENLLSINSSEEIKWKPSEDKWCLLEIVNHLYDEEREDFRARLGKILNQDSEWDPIDPEGWVTSRNYMEKDYFQVLKNFLEERKKSIEWLRNLKVDDWNIKVTHPKFGEFAAYPMLCNWLAHDYLHIRQIIRLKYQMLEAGLKSGELGYAGEW
jgi:hypothetical protein